MSSDKTDVTLGCEYSLDRIEKIAPLAGMQGDDWYRYIVKRKNGEIVGNRCGSYQQVSDYAQSFTDGLNERANILGNTAWTRHRRY